MLSELIAADIADLDRPGRQVLAAVAVIGRDTSDDLLAAATDLSGAERDATVHAALEARVLVAETEADAIRLRHPLIGEVVYAGLLPSERRRLHRRVADALSADGALALTASDVNGELAFHLDRAGDRGAAFTASLAAADAAAAFSPATALEHLERALALWDDVGPRDASRGARPWQAADLAMATGLTDRAVELARRGSRLGPHPAGAAHGHERLGRYLWAGGRIEESAASYQRAAAAVGLDEPSTAAPVHAGLGQAEATFCRFESAERWSRRALDAAPASDVDAGTWAMATRVLGLVHSARGWHDEAIELCRQAVAHAPTAHARALASAYLTIVLLSAARYEQAVVTTLDAIAAGEGAGLDRSFGAFLGASAAEAFTKLGRWADADALLARVTAAETIPIGAAALARAGSLLAARRGQTDRARTLLRQAPSDQIDPMNRINLDYTAAEVELLAGAWKAAAGAADELWSRPCADDATWPARIALVDTVAAVESTLDALARHEPVDVDATVARLRRRLDEASARAQAAGAEPSPLVLAHVAHGTATLTRLGTRILTRGPSPSAGGTTSATRGGLRPRACARPRPPPRRPRPPVQPMPCGLRSARRPSSARRRCSRRSRPPPAAPGSASSRPTRNPSTPTRRLGMAVHGGHNARARRRPGRSVAPVLAYPHDGRCGVTGGGVYRGEAIPALQGAYLYADLCDGMVRAMSVVDGAVAAERAFEGAQAGCPVSFGTDLTGEMYLHSFDLNTVFRLVPE